MTEQQEIEYIDAILALMLIQEEKHLFIQDTRHGLGYTEDEAMYLRDIMQHQGLIKNSDGPGKNGLSKLMAPGEKIANAPGGYKALKQDEQRKQKLAESKAMWQDTMQKEQHELLRKQHEQQIEQLRLSRLSTDAAVSSAASAATSTYWGRVSGVTAIVSALIAAAAILFAYRSDKANDATTERLEALEVQFKQLRVTTSPVNPPQ